MEGNEEPLVVVTVGDKDAGFPLFLSERFGLFEQAPDCTFLTRFRFDEDMF